MNKWSRNRKRIILGIVILFVVGLIGLPLFLIFYKAPTCFDGKMNGDERGIDCGGSCQLLCSAESLSLLTKGDPRVLTLAPNTYQVVAMIENANSDAEVYKAGYILRVYDAESSIPVRVIEGQTYVPKGATFALFEGPFKLEEDIIPRRAMLEWKEDTIIWKKTTAEVSKLTITNKSFSRLDSTPRLEATLNNTSLTSVSNIDLVATVFDAQGNIFAASKTFVDTLGPGGDTRIVFTWPRPFGQEPVGSNIVIRVFPDRSFIR